MTDGRVPARGELPMCRAVVDVVCAFPRSNVLNGDESDVCAYGLYQSVHLRGGDALGPHPTLVPIAAEVRFEPFATAETLAAQSRRSTSPQLVWPHRSCAGDARLGKRCC